MSKPRCLEMKPTSRAKDHRIYCSKIADNVRADGSTRSRFCLSACSDQRHQIFTAPLTPKRITLSLLLSVSVTSEHILHTADVRKSVVPSDTALRRSAYIKSLKEMSLASGEVMMAVKPNCGMPDTSVHLFKIITGYHQQNMKVWQMSVDLCLMFCREE